MVRRTLSVDVACVALVLGAGSAGAGVVVPTRPASSSGTATGEIATGPSGTFMFIYFSGTLRLGDQTRYGAYLIDFPDFTSTSATLRLEDATLTPIGTCNGENTIWLELDAPAAAVMRCAARFPGQGTTRSTVLTFALPTWGEAGCRQCSGIDYNGRYVG